MALFLLQLSCFAEGGGYPDRIVSLSPAITEILYELGLGDRVIGVTDYCNFPEEAKEKSRVGGFLNTNYEAVILLKPDLVIMPVDYGPEIKDVLDKTGIKYITVNTFAIEDILNSIKEIGQRCGRDMRAEQVVSGISAEIGRLRKKVREIQSRRIMVVVGRNAGTFENLYIAGRDTFYDELLNTLGCKNVYRDSGIRYPALSLEGVLRLNPDIIIEILPELPDNEKADIISEWSFLEAANAVRNNRVYVLNGDHVCIPGPRFIITLKDMARVLTNGKISNRDQ